MTTNTARWAVTNEWVDLGTGSTVTPEEPPTPTPGFWFTLQGAGNDARNDSSAYNKNNLYIKIAAAMGRSEEAWPLGGRHKFFDGGAGFPTSVNNHTVDTPACTDPYPVYCFKSYSSSVLNARMASITEPEVWVYDQEFYGGTDPSGWTTYNNHYQTIRNLRDAHANGHLVEIQMVSSNADERANPGGFALANAAYADSWGSDSYNAKQNAPYTAGNIFGRQYEAHQAMLEINPDIKWVISEYGLSRIKVLPDTLYTGQERLDHLYTHIEYLINHGCSGLTYWAVDNTRESAIKDWSIDKGTEADDVFAAGLADLIELYPVPDPSEA